MSYLKIYAPVVALMVLVLHAPLSPAEETAEYGLIDELVVTARRAPENVKDVPFTVNLIDFEEIRLNRLHSLDELFRQVPGVEFSTFGATSNGLNVRIRGVGAIAGASRDDTSVIIYVDDVPQPVGFSTIGTLDMESVEVLKGPQGTLFGRNSEGGAVQIVTARPVFETAGYLRGEHGEDAQFRAVGMYNTAVTDNVAARLALSYEGEDSHILNFNTSTPLTTPRNLNARGKLRWDVNEEVSVEFSSTHVRTRNFAFVYSLYPQTEPPTMDAPPDTMDNDRDIDQWNLRVFADLGFADFTSVTAYSDSEDRSTGILYEGRVLRSGPVGFVPIDYGPVNNLFQRQFFNQELRLNSTRDSNVFWVAGVSFYDDSSRYETFGFVDPFFFPAIPLNADLNERKFDTTSAAVFGEATYPIADKLAITGGVRYTWEQKDFAIAWMPNAFNPNPLRSVALDQDFEDYYLTGRVGLTYDFDDDVTVYGIYSRGYKGGGFAERGSNVARGLLDPPYKASKANSYEVGFKSTFGDGAIRVNGAAFFNDVADDHIFTFDFFTQITAPENFDTETIGFELELDWQVTDSLELQGAVNYTDAEIAGVPENSFAPVEEGNRIPNSPYWSASAALTHTHPLKLADGSGLTLRSRLSYGYSGARQATPANNLLFDRYHKLDLRIGIGNDRFELYLWGDNVLDEDIYTAGFGGGALGGASATIERGASFGGGASFDF
ncbi:MAG: TonB-dependent receptor [Gammaproteobacteria bacterium]|nr:TonB-dependent receptor [Gammaproteobacteria bacterium]MCY4283376.1 TonB-dependent receptor [Gammaproteobacteria bacterium]